MNYTDNDRINDFVYFKEIYDDLYRKYGHKFIAIRNKEILGVFDSISDAINMLSSSFVLGTYIIQECNGDETGYTNYISSW